MLDSKIVLKIRVKAAAKSAEPMAKINLSGAAQVKICKLNNRLFYGNKALTN